MKGLKPASRHLNNMFIAYTKGINKAYGRSGSLFEKPYRRKLVENERYFKQLVTYIHQNPQKHGFVSDFREWPWSSYRAVTAREPTRLEKEPGLAWFGGETGYLVAHDAMVNEAGIEPFIGDDWI